MNVNIARIGPEFIIKVYLAYVSCVTSPASMQFIWSLKIVSTDKEIRIFVTFQIFQLKFYFKTHDLKYFEDHLLMMTKSLGTIVIVYVDK